MLGTILAYRGYVWRTACADLRFRYSGTGVGLFWNVINPLMQVALYSLLFPFFRHHVPVTYVVFLCAGLFPWQSFSEALVRGSQALSRNAGLLRSLPVPNEVFVAQSSLTSLLGVQIMLALLVGLALLDGVPASLALVWLPFLGCLLHALGFGFSLSLAPLRVLFPDISEVLRSLLQLWMWSMPIVYAEPAAFDRHPWLALLNPPYPFVRSIRAALLEQRHVDVSTLAVMIAWAAASLLVGALVSRKLRRAARDRV